MFSHAGIWGTVLSAFHGCISGMLPHFSPQLLQQTSCSPSSTFFHRVFSSCFCVGSFEGLSVLSRICRSMTTRWPPSTTLMPLALQARARHFIQWNSCWAVPSGLLRSLFDTVPLLRSVLTLLNCKKNDNRQGEWQASSRLLPASSLQEWTVQLPLIFEQSKVPVTANCLQSSHQTVPNEHFQFKLYHGKCYIIKTSLTLDLWQCAQLQFAWSIDGYVSNDQSSWNLIPKINLSVLFHMNPPIYSFYFIEE